MCIIPLCSTFYCQMKVNKTGLNTFRKTLFVSFLTPVSQQISINYCRVTGGVTQLPKVSNRPAKTYLMFIKYFINWYFFKYDKIITIYCLKIGKSILESIKGRIDTKHSLKQGHQFPLFLYTFLNTQKQRIYQKHYNTFHFGFVQLTINNIKS